MSTTLVDQKSLNYLLASLEPKQKEYALLRAKGMLPIAATAELGYADPAAYAERFEKNLTIRSAIEYAVRISAREAQITRDDVVAGFLDATRLAATASEMVMAWREIGKIVGAYAPIKVEHNHTHTIMREQLEQMDDEELAKLAAIDADFVVLENGE